MKWRADALENRQCDQIAWTAFWMALCWGQAECKPADFHPIELLEKARRDEELAAQAPAVLKSLPATMSEAEIDAEWIALKAVMPKG